jgi:hypothetical protein
MNGHAGKINSVAQKYEALGNAVNTAVDSFNLLRSSAINTGDDAALQNFSQSVSDFISSNTVLAQRFKEITGSSIDTLPLERAGASRTSLFRTSKK